MSKTLVKVGFCVAYDWHLLQYAIPLIYDSADSICLSLDKDRISWAGMTFDFDKESFKKLIEKLDGAHKIKVYEDDFHQPSLTPMQNEVRQRNMMATFMGKDGWHVQLDADEYFIKFSAFTDYLQSLGNKRPVNIICPFVTLWKKLDEGFLYVAFKTFNEFDKYPVATNKAHYEFGRRNGYFNVVAPWYILHQSWARHVEEVQQKINNWGHKTDFNTAAYFDFWKSVTKENYEGIKNFHPIDPTCWPSLSLLEVNDPASLIRNVTKLELPVPSKRQLLQNNSIWLSRIKAVTKKMFG